MRILDLFCGAGGASMGINYAGHVVEGVDNNKWALRYYPFKSYLADALEFPLEGYDAYFASPPCQSYSTRSHIWRVRGREYPDLIDAVRERLLETGKPFVIENVTKSPLRKDLVLCGQMFRLGVFRHRVFEIHGFTVPVIEHVKHNGHIGDGKYITAAGHNGGVGKYRSPSSKQLWMKAMGIDWNMAKCHLAEAIPPAYTEYIFGYLSRRPKCPFCGGCIQKRMFSGVTYYRCHFCKDYYDSDFNRIEDFGKWMAVNGRKEDEELPTPSEESIS